MKVTIYNSLAEPVEVRHEYGLEISNKLPSKQFDAVVLGVAHKEFLEQDMRAVNNGNSVIYDVK